MIGYICQKILMGGIDMALILVIGVLLHISFDNIKYFEANTKKKLPMDKLSAFELFIYKNIDKLLPWTYIPYAVVYLINNQALIFIGEIVVGGLSIIYLWAYTTISSKIKVKKKTA